jgi:hypothetical protein
MASTENKKPDLRLPIGSCRLAVFVFHRKGHGDQPPAAPASSTREFAEIGAKLEGYA